MKAKGLFVINVLTLIWMEVVGSPLNVTEQNASQAGPRLHPKKVPAMSGESAVIYIPKDSENAPRLDINPYLRRTGDRDGLRHSNPLERDPMPPVMRYPTGEGVELFRDIDVFNSSDDTSHEDAVKLRTGYNPPLPSNIPQSSGFSPGLTITITPLMKNNRIPGIGYGVYGGMPYTDLSDLTETAGTNIVPQYPSGYYGGGDFAGSGWTGDGSYTGYYGSDRVPGFPRSYPGKYGYIGISFRPGWYPGGRYPGWYPAGKYPGWYPAGKYPGWYPSGKRPGGIPGRPGGDGSGGDGGDGGVGPPGSGRGNGGTFGDGTGNLDTSPSDYSQYYQHYI